MRELSSDAYVVNYAKEIRVFYDHILSESHGLFNEDSAFAALEKHYTQLCSK